MWTNDLHTSRKHFATNFWFMCLTCCTERHLLSFITTVSLPVMLANVSASGREKGNRFMDLIHQQSLRGASLSLYLQTAHEWSLAQRKGAQRARAWMCGGCVRADSKKFESSPIKKLILHLKHIATVWKVGAQDFMAWTLLCFIVYGQIRHNSHHRQVSFPAL